MSIRLKCKAVKDNKTGIFIVDKSKRDERIFQENHNKQGCLMKIITYVDTLNVVVEFQDEYRFHMKSTYWNFVNGGIKNPYFKSIYNVACIGESTSRYQDGTIKKSYECWNSMIKRCYKDRKTNHSYVDIFVCDEWLIYANFEKWYEENFYSIKGETMCLDKDILSNGTNQYSPNTCCFVPHNINILFIKNTTGKSYNGVYFNEHGRVKKRYQARCSIRIKEKGKLFHIGSFYTEQEAFDAYRMFKLNYIKEIADLYKDKIPDDIYNAILKHDIKKEKDVYENKKGWEI